jgi:ParB-like nuclease domain
MLNFKSVPAFDYEAHELANLLPMTSASEFANLKADIAANGLLQPIWLFEGRILDGRNRYRACREIGYSFGAADFREFEGDYAAAEAFVFSTNFQRRQLSKAQMNEVIKTMILKYPSESTRQIARRCGLNSHSQVANVMGKMKEPSPEQKQFEQFCKAFDALPDHHRTEFAMKFAPDLCELLGVQKGQSK